MAGLHLVGHLRRGGSKIFDLKLFDDSTRKINQENNNEAVAGLHLVSHLRACGSGACFGLLVVCRLFVLHVFGLCVVVCLLYIL